MSTFFFLVFLGCTVFLFGAGAWHWYQTRREFKRGWAELERMLEDEV